jgi:serine/threonine protein kinase/formylglycine-generating enzyme required for sulfatase activity
VPGDQVETARFTPTARSSNLQPMPAKIGRYRIQQSLGGGGFGSVYLAQDEELGRPVAIKVPLAGRLGSEGTIASVLREAQHAAGLRHPGIVMVYDFGRLPDGTCYFVMEYVPGRSLAQVLREELLSLQRAASLTLELAEALQHAHRQGLVHRDLKPSNILLDHEGHPRITDFGLAIDEQTQIQLQGEVAGTPVYMAPEQVRGEAHRLDARTDLWSLGVMLYEMLTGRRPFAGRREELFEEILQCEPKRPRQLNNSLPAELERICLKCLAKRMSDRYASSTEVVDDLREWLDQQREASTQRTVPLPANETAAVDGVRTPLSTWTERGPRVVPKGLRAFDVQDADFFLRLLPGPRDRHGLPDSLAFWKSRLEERDDEKTFSVGLIYGPSGCGKTSLLKAGLLSRLAPHVLAVYLEATPRDTERRLLNSLRKRCPGISAGRNLGEVIARLREDQGHPNDTKVVLVIDQFEQWLHANRDMPDAELVRALRHCDGAHVQCLLLVRDDFWMAVSTFFRNLEVRLLEGQNSAPVDLFSTPHARKVLAEFGRAFGCLPEAPGALTPDQEEFLDQAVSELANDGKVTPVRLSLFAEMVKTRDWTSGTMRALGGTRGLGANFLEQTFSSPTAPLRFRRQEPAARAVLKSLLPDRVANIKGMRRSREELLAASGYSRRSDDFEELLRILDAELRLVTPADPEESPLNGATDVEHPAPSPPQFYQLAHDYLVPSIREWLTRKQKETWRGRAELRLEERAAQWGRLRDPRFLPTLWEYLAIRLGVPRAQRKPEERAMLRAATRHHGLRWGLFLAILAVLAFGVQRYVASVRHFSRSQRAETLVQAVLDAPAEGVPYTLDNLQPVRDLAMPLLHDRLEDTQLDPRSRLRAAEALASYGDVQEDFLLDHLATAPPGESRNVLVALEKVRPQALVKLRQRFLQDKKRSARVRLAATALGLGDPEPTEDLLAYRPNPSQRTAFIHDFASWHGNLAELAPLLRGTDNLAFRSGLCAALGAIKPDDLHAGEQEPLQAVLEELCQDVPDSGTHSSADWALRQWGIIPRQPSTSEPGRAWFVTKEGLTMLSMAPGEFLMGDRGYPDAQPHRVTLTRSFYLCDQEVPNELYLRFLAETDVGKHAAEDGKLLAEIYAQRAFPDPSLENRGERKLRRPPNQPAVMVNWTDALLFCNWLSRREGRAPCYHEEGGEEIKRGGKALKVPVWHCDFAADGYRLPTEAEWEYACRAGTTTRWSFGDDQVRLSDYAVFISEAAAPCRSKLPNAWGLFDMHGNAREWCWDRYKPRPPPGAAVDPHGEGTSPDHVHRGGSWQDHAHACRSGFRNRNQFDFRDDLLGFRVAVTTRVPGSTN